MGTLAAVFVPLFLPFSALLPLLPFEVDRSPSSCTRGEMGEDGRLKRITQANIKQWEPLRLARRIDGESQTFSSEIEKEGGGGWNGGNKNQYGLPPPPPSPCSIPPPTKETGMGIDRRRRGERGEGKQQPRKVVTLSSVFEKRGKRG